MDKPTVIHEILGHIQDAVVTFGWPVLITLLVLYFSRDYIKKCQEQISLRRAQNPHRVKILEEERKRVRLKQQMAINKALLEQKEIEAEAPPELEIAAPKKPKPKTPSPSSGGFNPLGGGGNIHTFKPTGGGMRNAGRRRG